MVVLCEPKTFAMVVFFLLSSLTKLRWLEKVFSPTFLKTSRLINAGCVWTDTYPSVIFLSEHYRHWVMHKWIPSVVQKVISPLSVLSRTWEFQRFVCPLDKVLNSVSSTDVCLYLLTWMLGFCGGSLMSFSYSVALHSFLSDMQRRCIRKLWGRVSLVWGLVWVTGE